MSNDRLGAVGVLSDLIDVAMIDCQRKRGRFTKFSADPVLVRMVAAHGSEQYMKNNKSLPLTERGLGLLEEIESLED